MAEISITSIDAVTKECLKYVEVPEKSIEIILRTIHYANRREIPTHGVGRLPLYVKKIQSGKLNPREEVEVISDVGATSVLDAHGGFGQVAAQKAVEMAGEKAQKYGISVTAVRNSNNFGTAGYFGEVAAKKGLAAMIYSNAAPAMAPIGGKKPIFGTNPLCYAFPGGQKCNPIILDMATTVAARGKIRSAAKNGEKIPFDWAVDINGNATEDPYEALAGSLLPIAGYKGYGLAAFVDLFAGLLTGSAFAGDVKPLSNMEETSRNGHLFVLIDVAHFLEEEEITEKVIYFNDKVKECGEAGKILLPGERGYAAMKKHIESVVIVDKQVEEINKLAENLGVIARLEHI